MSRPPVYLLTGPEELLLRRAADALLAELREEGELEVTEVRGPDLAETGLPDLRTASLFGERRAVVVRDAGDLPAAVSAGLVDELESAAPPDAIVVLLATRTGRITKLAKRVKELGGRVDLAPPKPWDERGWQRLVADELARHGREADPEAIASLLAHAGTDVSAIAEKVAQVAATAPAGRIGPAGVDAVVVGHGNRGSFAIADAMCERQPAEALTLLRGALEAGEQPVVVLGALAYRIRTLVAVAGKIPAKEAGLSISDGMRRRLERVRRNFGPGELTAAARVLADADAELKGGELPEELVLERAVLSIATPAGA